MIKIASSLPPVQNEYLASHHARPEVIALTGAAWEVPLEAEALFTFQTQWRHAPKEKPAGWPFNLKWIQVGSAGVDTFPVWAYEVPLITRGRGVQAPMIGEYVIGAIFAHEKQFWDQRVTDRAGWQPTMLGAVSGKTLGIAGFGAIGTEAARLALALGMKVVALTRSSKIDMVGVESIADLDGLMALSDHLVIAMPQTPQTERIFNAERFANAKPGLHVINVARGILIDDEALVAAIDGGRISAATLDVTMPEPPPEGHPFYSHPRIRLTAHVSGGSEDADKRLARYLAKNLDDYLAGNPVTGVVEYTRGY
ncbi:Phosphoglycerate dehydrogenase [Rhizobium sp. CF080]|uniref:NAD(P)-dependent oxidoreductase n=1 Tax=Rhizobium sp. (strain CF080) TaxID=1144310 RepID=UPI000271817B|nr:NAD(P)-dependent oxidoreductase [Rhizobium sp. CF080]EUC00016.1 Phosphoglycerate dehydrogenase [Rhizobium sp. CF080]